MKKNNKGLTLIEMIISFGLLGIVMVMASGLISTGSHTYRSVSSDIDLQYESQVAMSQLQEYIIDCNAGICFSDSEKALYVVNNDPSGYKINIFNFDSDSNRIVYASVVLSPGVTYNVIDEDDMSYMAGHVTDFSTKLSTSSNITTAFISIGFSRGEKSFQGTQTVTLRNSVTTASDINALLTKLAE